MIQILILALAVLTEPIQIFDMSDIPDRVVLTLPYIDIKQNISDYPGFIQKLDSTYCYMINSHDYRNYHDEAFIELIIWKQNESLNFSFCPAYHSMKEYKDYVAAKRNDIFLGYNEYKNIPIVIFKHRDVSGLKISADHRKIKKFFFYITGVGNDDRPAWCYRAPIRNTINYDMLNGMMLYEMYKYVKWRLHRIESYIISLKLSLQENMKSERRYRYWYRYLPYWGARGLIY